MIQLTIAVDDAHKVQLLATMCEVAVKGHDAACCPPHITAATDWYLNQLRFAVDKQISQFDSKEVERLVASLRRAADMTELCGKSR